MQATAETNNSHASCAAAVKAVCSEYRIHNADVHLKEDCDVDDLVDCIEGSRVYIPCIYVLNKIDQVQLLVYCELPLSKLSFTFLTLFCVRGPTGVPIQTMSGTGNAVTGLTNTNTELQSSYLECKNVWLFSKFSLLLVKGTSLIGRDYLQHVSTSWRYHRCCQDLVESI